MKNIIKSAGFVEGPVSGNKTTFTHKDGRKIEYFKGSPDAIHDRARVHTPDGKAPMWASTKSGLKRALGMPVGKILTESGWQDIK